MSQNLPTYNDFVKNPIVALLFMCLMAIGYLYYDNRKTLVAQIEDLKVQVRDLKEDNKKLYYSLIEIQKKVK